MGKTVAHGVSHLKDNRNFQGFNNPLQPYNMETLSEIFHLAE
jgi:hypothetical protein